MKKIIIFAVLLSCLSITLVHADSSEAESATIEYETNETNQSSAELFEKISDIKGVDVVYISKSMLGMMPNMNMGNMNVGQVAGKLTSLEIYNVKGGSAFDQVKNISGKLINGGDYETMMLVKESDSKTAFYSKKKKSDKQESEMLMVTEEKEIKAITIIRFMGNFTVQDIQNLQKGKK